MTRRFMKLSDLGGREGLLAVLDQADHFKNSRGEDRARPLLDKTIALVFQKASTRTRLSLEVAVNELGGHPIVLTSSGSQLGRGEPIRDTARVLGRMVHAITFRTFSEADFLEMTEFSGLPVLNSLTDRGHPMQLLADLMTVRRSRGSLDGVSCAWLGDGNNMANSWIEAAGLLGFRLRLACPEGYDPDAEYLALAREQGADIQVVRDPRAAVEGVDVVSTDVFASMGQEEEAQARVLAFEGYELNESLLSHAAANALVLHCLPAHRGEEISEAVLEGPQSCVWDQAEARLHTSKAVLAWALSAEGPLASTPVAG